MARPLRREDLLGAWVHAHEEDTEGPGGPRRVYVRAEGARLPPSRGRRGLRLEPDGTAVLTGPGAADRAGAVPGRWDLEDGSVLRLALSGGEAGAWRVEEVARDRLVLRSVEEAGGGRRDA